MTIKPVRRYKLSFDKAETIEDVKKLLSLLNVYIDTDNPLFKDFEKYVGGEVVPKGYILLLQTIGEEEIAKMTYEEMEQKISELRLLNID